MDRKKQLRMALFLGLAIGIVAGMILAALAVSPVMMKVEASQGPSNSLVLERSNGFRREGTLGYQYLWVVCDKETGNLVYLTNTNSSSYAGVGIALDKGGCQPPPPSHRRP